MGEYLGLRGPSLILLKEERFESLKQDALFFDRIGVMSLNDCLKSDNKLTTFLRISKVRLLLQCASRRHP
jgi:hypothetical protein